MSGKEVKGMPKSMSVRYEGLVLTLWPGWQIKSSVGFESWSRKEEYYLLGLHPSSPLCEAYGDERHFVVKIEWCLGKPAPWITMEDGRLSELLEKYPFLNPSKKNPSKKT
jgi:hypothetical protein